METANIAALVILVITGIMIFFGVGNWWPVKPTPKTKSGPSATTTVGASGGAATTPTPPTPPTPAPTASPRSWGWVWLLVAILAAIIAYYVVLPALRNSTPTPQATAPKRELQQRIVPCNLRFVGGDEILKRDSFIGVRKGGRAFFVTHTLPWRNDAVFHVVVKISQKNTSKIFIKINGGITKDLTHPGSPDFTNVVFFEAGEVGSPSYFNPTGVNNIEVSSEKDMIIQCVSIEMFYHE